MPTRRKTLPLYPKELSWLSFNARVLQEAEDPEVPLIERVRFMGIFSNNLDEFYRVRYAEVRRLAAFAKGREKARWEKLLDDIRDAVGDLQMRFDRVYRTCLAQLRDEQHLPRRRAPARRAAARFRAPVLFRPRDARARADHHLRCHRHAAARGRLHLLRGAHPAEERGDTLRDREHSLGPPAALHRGALAGRRSPAAR